MSVMSYCSEKDRGRTCRFTSSDPDLTTCLLGGARCAKSVLETLFGSIMGIACAGASDPCRFDACLGRTGITLCLTKPELVLLACRAAAPRPTGSDIVVPAVGAIKDP